MRMENARLIAQHKHKYLKGLSAAQLNDLYQDDPFDEEVELQASLSRKIHYSDAMSISINSIIAMKNYKLHKKR